MSDKITFKIMRPGDIDKNNRKYDLDIAQKAFREFVYSNGKEIEKQILEYLNCGICEEKPPVDVIIHRHEPSLNNIFLWAGPNYERRVVENEYRKFIEESKYGRITARLGQISVPIVFCSESN